MTPTLVLTRPEAQSRELAAALPGLPVVTAPVMEITATGAAVDLGRYAGVILTSANGVAEGPDLHGIRAYCVGKRTAEAARACGAEVALVARDAADLVARFEGGGPVLHLRGEHARGDIAERLSSAGIETHEAVVYRQDARPLTAEAKALIEGEAPVVLPLYSPRSAALVAAQLARVGPLVQVIAMSPAVAEAWGRPAEVCEHPTGAEMLRRIRAACGAKSP
jgi:uroporphyrinogen-III synthase